MIHTGYVGTWQDVMANAPTVLYALAVAFSVVCFVVFGAMWVVDAFRRKKDRP